MTERKPLRRRRGARALVVAASLGLLSLLYAGFSPATRSVADATAQVAQGRALFATNCASCHGLGGEGLPAENVPSLINVGAAAVEFQVSTGRMPAANTLGGAQAKPNTFTEDEIAAMAAFVASLGDGPAIPTENQYATRGLTPEQIAQGGDMFRANCSACHNFKGAGGALPSGLTAPGLAESSAQHIWEAMRTGPGQMPVFASNTIPDADVKKIIAYLEQVNSRPSAGFTLGGIGPVSEGLFAWIVGIGGLVLFAIWITTRGARR